MYDLVIVGGGPAGMAAALYAARANLKVLIVEGLLYGGQMQKTDCIENFPSYDSISGEELSEKMEDQMFTYNVDEVFGYVTKIIPKDNYNTLLLSDDKTVDTKTVLIATGAKHKLLNVPGEQELTNKGVSYCALCDATFFKDKELVVVGGGDSALEEALYLTNYATKVTIVHRRDEFRAQLYLQEKVKANPKIAFELSDEVTSINGTDCVESVTLKSGKTLKTDGVFIYVGQEPSTNFVSDLGITNEAGWICVDSHFQTKIPSIFAAGDCIAKDIRQIVTATGDGANAAQYIYQHLLEN